VTGLRVVALGGGHGLHATLSALRRRADAFAEVTAVVTVADDGGSSGRLRRELGLLPPGDLRMALAALAADDERGRFWADLVQHRFGGSGALAGHAVGNLLLAGLLEVTDDPVATLDTVAGLLGCHGRVLPMATVPLEIEADVELEAGSTHLIRGQVAVASTPGRVHRVWLRPEEPPACPEAVRAVREADVVLLGPGSWFTSVLPHLLVPGLRDALLETSARRVVLLNLAPEPGETAGFSPEQHLDVLSGHAPSFSVHAVVADTASVPLPDRLRRSAAAMLAPGGQVWFADIADGGSSAPRHDPAALAECLVDLVGAGGGPGGGAAGDGVQPRCSDQGVPPRSGVPGREVGALGEGDVMQQNPSGGSPRWP
jgi:uncharacterized cofD-like protein